MKALVKAKGLEGLFYIESAAVSSEEIGNPIYPPAKRCLTQHGVWFDPAKTARRLTLADYTRFDLILYMDTSNLRWIRRIIPDDPARKIRHMMSFATPSSAAAGKTGHFPSVTSVSGLAAGKSAENPSVEGFGVRPLRDVADPWYTGDFEQTFQDLLEGCEGLLACL